jgi:hypothetical protein
MLSEWHFASLIYRKDEPRAACNELRFLMANDATRGYLKPLVPTRWRVHYSRYFISTLKPGFPRLHQE